MDPRKEDQKATQELIADYYTKDRWYVRLTLLLVSLLTLIATYFLITQFQNSNHNQAVIKDLVSQIKKNQDDGNKQILDHLDCIVLFLSQNNRANIRIQDLQGCKITGGTASVAQPSPKTPQVSESLVTQPQMATTQPSPPSPPKRSFISPAVDVLNRVLKGIGL